MTNERIYELTNIMKDVYEDLATAMNKDKPEQEYDVKIITEHTYTVTARDEQEAAIRAVRRYDEEGKSNRPIPAMGSVIVNGETIIGGEETSKFDSYYWADANGMESDTYEYGCDLCADIVEMYRLTTEEKAELEKEVALLEKGGNISFDLPFTTLYIYRGDEE